MSKNLLITGSSRGIGAAIARLAHSQGYTVILNSRSDSDDINALYEELVGSHKLIFDVADKDQTYSVINEWIEETGNIHYVVNNAGIALNVLRDLSEMTDDNAIKEYKTNVLGPLHVIDSVIEGMKTDEKGSVVNLASIKGHPQLSTLSSITYATTKAGVISMTKSLAKAYAKYSIRFNSVSPGYIETGMIDNWDEEKYNQVKSNTLANRIGKPSEIAELVLFLLSDKASYINGSDVLADGGYMLKGK